MIRAMDKSPNVLFCNCTYADVVPAEVKSGVLERLNSCQVPFLAVADLCDMSARRDPALQRIAESPNLRIAACFPRAVRWLFHAADAPLVSDDVEIMNMRTDTIDEVTSRLLPRCCGPAGGES